MLNELDATNQERLLCFQLDSENYAVDFAKVQEITYQFKVSHANSLKPYVLGMVTLHDVIFPIIDLRFLLYDKRSTLTSNSIAVVLQTHKDGRNHQFGVLVDSVSDVLSIDKDKLDYTSEITTLASSNYVAGVARVEEQMIVVLAVDEMVF